MKLLLTLSLIVASGTAIFAQETAAPANGPISLPPGPLIKPFPNRVRLTITRKTSTDASQQRGDAATSGAKGGQKDGAATFDIQIVGEKVGDISHTVTTYANGNKKEVWRKGEQQTTMSTGWKQPIAGTASDEAEDLSWISATNFAGIQKIAGRECMVFREKLLPQVYRIRPDLLTPQEGPKTADDQAEEDRLKKVLGDQDSTVDPANIKLDAAASIDVESRLPMSLQMGHTVTTYKYEPLPADYNLALPPEVTSAIETRGQQIQASTRKPVRP